VAGLQPLQRRNQRLITLVFSNIGLTGCGVRQHPFDARCQRQLGGGEITECAAADHGRHRGTQTAGFLNLRQFYRQAADVGEHLHPGRRFGGAAGDAQRFSRREALPHAVKVGHMTEHHAFVDRLHQMFALVEGL